MMFGFEAVAWNMFQSAHGTNSHSLMSLSVSRTVPARAARTFSTIDWTDVTSKLSTDAAKSEINRLRALYGEQANLAKTFSGPPAPIDFAFLAAPSFLRPFGLLVAPSKAPKAPLVLHAAEPEWGCKLVCHASRAARGERAPHMPPLNVADACVGPRAPVISSAPVHPPTARERRDTSAASR